MTDVTGGGASALEPPGWGVDPRNTLANLGDTLGVARGSSGSTRENPGWREVA